MKSKMSKKLIAFILCMVLVICNSVSILADTPAPETATVEKQVKETKTANDKKASDDEAGDTENVSPQSEESAPEVKTTEKKEETTEATTQKKDEADEVTTKAKEETEKADETTTEAKETTKKEETTETQEEKTTKAKEETSETSGKKDTEKTTEAEEKTAPTELTYDDENVTVTVSAVAEGAIPEGAELKVVPILKNDTETQAQYTEVEKKIQEKAAETETDIKGFLAYDITFVDEDGNEIEPNSEVKVSMEYKKAAIPAELTAEEAKNAEVSVMHLEEDDAGNVSKVVDMSEAGKVDTLDAGDEKQVNKVEVRTNSFSAFVITWTYYSYYWKNGSETIHYVDSDGNSLDDLVSGTWKIENEHAITLKGSQCEVDISGYTYQYATVANGFESAPISSTKILRIRPNDETLQYSQNESGSHGWENLTKNQAIYMVYEKDSSSGGGGGSSATGNLAHRKYVTVNDDGTYNLTLNVTGAVGTETNPAKVDVVLLVDVSTSMNEKYSWGTSKIDKTKEAVKELTEALEEKSDTVDSQWKIVTFGETGSIRTPEWVSSNQAYYSVNGIRIQDDVGTNYEDGFTKVASVMKNARKDAEKIVIFLTDGEPTLYGSNGNGPGNCTTQSIINRAVDEAGTISCNQFYAVGIGLDNITIYEEGLFGSYHENGSTTGNAILTQIKDKVTSATKKEVYNTADPNTDLTEVFEDIAGNITTYTATNVSITDTLTEEVDKVGGSELEVKVTDKNGQDVTNTEVRQGGIEAKYDEDTKQLNLLFNENYVLKEDYTYSVTIRIQTNETAKKAYEENGYEYPDVGEEGTDAPDNIPNTSSGKKGFFSNVENSAKVTWTTNGEEKEGLYNRPVVQLPKEDTPTPPPTTEKELSREKYVKDNKDGTYDLTLNVSGQVGSLEQKAKVDIVFVLDMSGSMANKAGDGKFSKTNLAKAQEAISTLTTDLENKETVDSQWKLVTFSNRLRPEDSLSQNWVDAKTIRDKVNDFESNYSRPFDDWWVDTGDCAGGTNYEAALKEAGKQIQTGRSDAEKIVIFLTDGQPTYYGDNIEGGKTTTKKEDYQGALRGAEAISCNQFYAIGMNLPKNVGYDNMSGTKLLQDVTNKVSATTKRSQNVDENSDLSDVFAGIAGSLTSFLCSDVTITDTLSDYAEIADENAELKITVKRNAGTDKEEPVGTSQEGTVKDGATLNLPESETNKAAILTASYDENRKQIVLDFPEDYQLEGDLTYYVTVEIAPTIAAYEKYTADNGYTDTGDQGTDAPDNIPNTSSGKSGFYCNKEATVAYTYNGTEQTSEYPKPVIQVDKLTTEDEPYITVTKTFSGLSKDQVEALKAKDSDADSANDFTITIKNQDNTESTDLKLSGGTVSDDGLIYTWKLPDYPAGQYSVTEKNAEVDGYTINTTGTGNIQISTGNWEFTPDVQEVDIQHDAAFNLNNLSVLMIALREPGSYLIWTKDSLSMTQQEAVKSAINGFNTSESEELKDFYTSEVKDLHFYSGESVLKNGISYGGSKVQYQNGTVKFGPSRQWKHVLAGTYQLENSQNKAADITVVNTYTLDETDIDFQKYGTTYDMNQLSATFRLEKMQADADGKHITEALDETFADEGSMESDITASNQNDFGGLPAGIYRLTETKAPTGYRLLSESIYFEITADGVNLVTITEDNEIQPIADNKTNMYQLVKDQEKGYIIKIKNEVLYDLPSAGGPGIYWYTLSGTLLMAGAALIVYRQKRKREVLLRK